MMNHKTRRLAQNAGVIILIIAGLWWVVSQFVRFGRSTYTDNAQIRQQIVPVNSRVAGFIEKIYFDEYAKVKKGDTLAIIEDSEFRLRLAQANADYQNATSGKNAMSSAISTTHNNLQVSDAALAEVCDSGSDGCVWLSDTAADGESETGTCRHGAYCT